MKNGKRLFALLAALAMMLCLLPAVAFAEETGAPAPGGEPGSNAVTLAEPTPAPTPEESWVDHPDAADPVITSFYSYSIGSGWGDSFSPASSVGVNQSDLTIRVYFRGTPPTADKFVSGLVFYGASFQDQSIKTRAYANQCYLDLVGIKYVGGDRVLNFSVCGASEAFVISECEAEQSNAGSPDSPDASVAGLVIKSSSIGKTSVNAGEEFTLSLTIYATTSGSKNVDDVVVSVSAAGESTGVTVASGSSSQYIGTMAPGSSKTVSFPMKALDSFTGGVSTIMVSVTGNGTTGASTNVSVPIIQPDRFEISRVECPEILMVGEEDVLSVVFVNKGRNSVNNLTVSLVGTNLSNPSQSEYVGNLAGGTENSVDFDISGLEAGQMTGTITVQYEGNDGQTVTLTQDVSCTIEEAYYEDPGMWEDPGFDVPTDVEPESTGLPLIAKILIGVGAAAAVVAAVVVVRKRKAKKAALEAEDEDF